MEECCEEDSVATRYCALNGSDVKSRFAGWVPGPYLPAGGTGLWRRQLISFQLLPN
jgi:hypothetical protein